MIKTEIFMNTFIAEIKKKKFMLVVYLHDLDILGRGTDICCLMCRKARQ